MEAEDQAEDTRGGKGKVEQWEQPLQGCSGDILEEDSTVKDEKPTQVAMMKEEVPRAGVAFGSSTFR